MALLTKPVSRVLLRINFSVAGTYTIRISGVFPAIYFNNGGDRLKILSVDQWGTGAWRTMASAFAGCTNLTSAATDTANTAQVTNMASTFSGATNFNGNISGWNTGNVTTMANMFNGANTFNQDLNSWNTAKVTTMLSMFQSATNFNGNITSWNTSNVTVMTNLFSGAYAFNQPIGAWVTTKVTIMAGAFLNARSFNQPLNNWNVGNVTNMSNMFNGTWAFNQDLNSWNTAKVVQMNGMFQGARVFNGNITSWNTAAVTTVSSMFTAALAFNQPIGSWNTGAVTSISGTFNQAASFNQPLNWNTAAVTNASNFVRDATSFDQSLAGFNMQAVTNATAMLQNSKLSVVNYDATLIGWSAQTLRNSVTLSSAAPLQYCAAQTQRQAIITTYGWVISGDTKGCPPPVVTITAPTKLSNATIGDTTIRIVQNYPTVTLNAANAAVSAPITTAGTSGFTCIQTSATQVDCTVNITSSGNLRISLPDSAGSMGIGTENNYIIDMIAPTSTVSIDTSSGLHTPTVTFITNDNVAVSRTDITYNTNNGGAGAGAPATITNATSPTALVLDPDELIHEITVRTYDTAGNFFDNIVRFPPVINFTAPTRVKNSPIHDATVTVFTPSGNDISVLNLTAGSTGATLAHCVGAGGDTTLPYAQPVTCEIQNITATGTVRIDATDAGNGATGNNQLLFTIETTPPTVSIASPTKRSNNPITNTVVTATDNYGVAAGDVALTAINQTGGFDISAVNCAQISFTEVRCTLTVNGDEGTGDIRVNVADLAGNTRTSTATGYVIDTTQPTATVTRAPGQATPTNVNSAQFEIVFSEPIFGFTVTDLTFGGTLGYVDSLTTTDNLTFTATVHGMDDGDTVTASLLAGRAADAAGNTNLASINSQNTVRYDATAPVVTITPLLTNQTSPALSGTINDASATITVTIDGTIYPAVNHGNGTWSLAAGIVTPALMHNTYDIVVTATDTAGNISTDATTDELTILEATITNVLAPNTGLAPTARYTGLGALLLSLSIGAAAATWGLLRKNQA